MQMDSELEEILLRWEEQRDRGEPYTLEGLCRDHPGRLDEARRLIRMLENVDDLIAAEEGATTDADSTARGPVVLPDDVSLASRCHVLHIHARGGLGDIFVGWDQELGREVALKLIQHPHERDPMRRERFVREAEITARLGHPGIVPIFGLGQTGDGRPCYTMRYIEGETLRAAITRFHQADAAGREPHERALAFRALLSRLITVCQAIAFAHSRGVIHRDIKPENVMLGPFQETLVVDWGLAKQWREPAERPEGPTDALRNDDAQGLNAGDSSLTRMGATLGTPAYMSPEQASGLWDEVGPASDVYSLGATLYFLLTGQPAFQDSSRHVLLDRVRRGEFPRPRQVKDTVPDALEAVCLKAMALRSNERYAHVLDLASELEHWLADEPVSAWREPPLARLGRWVRWHRPLVAGSAALAGTALLALAMSTLLLGREQSKTKAALDEARASYRMARATTADMQTSSGLAAERQTPAEAALWFAEAASTPDVDPERVAANRIRARAWSLISPRPAAMFDLSGTPASETPLRAIRQLDFDGRGRYLLLLTPGGTCVVHDIVKDRRVPLPGGARVVSAAAWGGKARDVLALGDPAGGVELVRVPQGEILATIQIKKGVSSLEFSKDGNRLALGGESSRVWDLTRKSFVTPELVHSGRALRHTLSPLADRLAVVTIDGQVWVYDLAKAEGTPLFKALPIANAPQAIPFRAVFVDDGRAVLALKRDTDFGSWYDATTGKEVRRLRSALNNITDVYLSPNGRAVVVTGLGGVEFWDAKTGEWRGQFGDAKVEASAFTWEGSWLLQANSHYVTNPVWFPSGDRVGWRVRQQDLPIRLAVAPDDAHFAVVQSNGVVHVWTLPETAPRHRRPMQYPPGVRLAMSADGRLVVPVGRHLATGPPSTRVQDLIERRVGPELAVNGTLHGGGFAPDGRELVTLSSPATPRDAPGWVTFWDWKRGVHAREPIRTPSEPFAAEYRPDGQRLAVLCSRGEFLWIDVTSGRIAASRQLGNGNRLTSPAEKYLRFSPDGKLLATWGVGPAVLLDAESGLDHSPALNLPPETVRWSVFDAQFSPDSRYLALSLGDKTTRIWNIAEGRAEGAPLEHPDWPFESVFSEDGSLLLTGSRDGNARVWDWRARRLAGPPMKHQGEVQDVAFLNDDRWVLTKRSNDELVKSYENAVQIWDWRSGKPLTPSRRMTSSWGTSLCVGPKGRFAALGGNAPGELHFLDLASWVRTDDPRFPADRLREITELASGEKIEGGSTVVNLTNAEWMERWRSYRAFLRDRPRPASKTP